MNEYCFYLNFSGHLPTCFVALHMPPSRSPPYCVPTSIADAILFVSSVNLNPSREPRFILINPTPYHYIYAPINNVICRILVFCLV